MNNNVDLKIRRRRNMKEKNTSNSYILISKEKKKTKQNKIKKKKKKNTIKKKTNKFSWNKIIVWIFMFSFIFIFIVYFISYTKSSHFLFYYLNGWIFATLTIYIEQSSSQTGVQHGFPSYNSTEYENSWLFETVPNLLLWMDSSISYRRSIDFEIYLLDDHLKIFDFFLCQHSLKSQTLGDPILRLSVFFNFKYQFGLHLFISLLIY